MKHLLLGMMLVPGRDEGTLWHGDATDMDAEFGGEKVNAG